jgi:hypothetical protein
VSTSYLIRVAPTVEPAGNVKQRVDMNAEIKINKLICSFLNSTPINAEKFHTIFIKEIITKPDGNVPDFRLVRKCPAESFNAAFFRQNPETFIEVDIEQKREFQKKMIGSCPDQIPVGVPEVPEVIEYTGGTTIAVQEIQSGDVASCLNWLVIIMGKDIEDINLVCIPQQFQEKKVSSANEIGYAENIVIAYSSRDDMLLVVRKAVKQVIFSDYFGAGLRMVIRMFVPKGPV